MWPFKECNYAPLCPQHTFSSLDFQMHHFCVILFLFLVYNCSFPIASVFMCFPLFSSVFHGFFLLFLIYHDSTVPSGRLESAERTSLVSWPRKSTTHHEVPLSDGSLVENFQALECGSAVLRSRDGAQKLEPGLRLLVA